MSRGEKANFEEIFERLAELEGDVRAITYVLVQHILACDVVLRDHADMVGMGIDELTEKLPRVPPNERLLESLQNLRRRLLEAVETYRQARESQD